MAAKRKKPRAKASEGRFINALVGFLFVVLILLAVAVSCDYILFAFHRTPVFAVTVEDAEAIEHVGLVYVVTERDSTLTWDWIWTKFAEAS